jgi:hypothetical protein
MVVRETEKLSYNNYSQGQASSDNQQDQTQCHHPNNCPFCQRSSQEKMRKRFESMELVSRWQRMESVFQSRCEKCHKCAGA